MRRKNVLIAILGCVLALTGCSAQKNYYTDLSQYGMWKETTVAMLTDNFSDSLPDSEDVSNYGYEYYYKSSQSVLGDENFVIYVVLRFPDEASYLKELSKYTSLQLDPVSQNHNTYYPIQYSNETFMEYTDGEYSDGMFYNFEIISTNVSEYTISFLNARVWDYYSDQVLVEYLQPIATISTQ